jgi:hypothetical protein
MTTTTTTLQNPNYLQPTGFKIIINRKRFGNLEFFANGVSHPSVSLSPAMTAFRSSDTYQPGDKLVFGDLSINAIMDESMYVYNEIYDWMSGLVQENQKPQHLTAGLEDTSMYDISVIILNSSNIKVRTIQYKNAFPTDIGTIEFASSTTSVESISFPITFRYDSFEFS